MGPSNLVLTCGLTWLLSIDSGTAQILIFIVFYPCYIKVQIWLENVKIECLKFLCHKVGLRNQTVNLLIQFLMWPDQWTPTNTNRDCQNSTFTVVWLHSTQQWLVIEGLCIIPKGIYSFFQGWTYTLLFQQNSHAAPGSQVYYYAFLL